VPTRVLFYFEVYTLRRRPYNNAFQTVYNRCFCPWKGRAYFFNELKSFWKLCKYTKSAFAKIALSDHWAWRVNSWNGKTYFISKTLGDVYPCRRMVMKEINNCSTHGIVNSNALFTLYVITRTTRLERNARPTTNHTIHQLKLEPLLPSSKLSTSSTHSHRLRNNLQKI